jgi:quercetin dioxygenase-like cupin family protein
MSHISSTSVLVAAASVAIGVVVLSRAVAAPAPEKDGEQVRVVTSYDLKEKIDGKDASATVVEVTIPAGAGGLPHRHPGPAIVYVIEGTYELGINDEPTKTFKAGESFTEPAGALHRVSRNPAASGTTRLVAVLLHARGVKDIAVPEKHH